MTRSVPAPDLVKPAPLPPITPPKVSVLPLTVMTRSAPRAIAPVPWVRLAVPVKVRSAPSVIALVIVAAGEASTTPPLTVKVPVPRAALFASTKVPAERVRPPPKVLAPPRMSLPAPDFVTPKPAPEMSPLSVSVFAATLIAREPVRVMAPLFCVRLAVPTKSRVAPSETALVIVAATDASSEPPLTVRSPAVPPAPPKAKVAEPATSVPAFSVVPPR